jgi:large subunit ribosomal protein L31
LGKIRFVKNPPPYGFKKYIDIRTLPSIKRQKMKKDLHPKLVACTVTCSCGNSFVTESQKDEMRIDICNECHPFFTGSERMVDTAGRIDKFNKRYAKK